VPEHDPGVTKRRITVTIDEDVYETAVQAVESGRSPSVSAWVNATLSDRQAHESRLNAAAEALAFFRAETGIELTEEELVEQERRDREAAAAVRAARATRRRAG
jgi:Arc/MetJ-type ribon-helix-helix transcriptional regulator